MWPRALFLALPALLLTAQARAQVAWAPPPGSFPVVVRANEPEVSFTLSKEKDSPPFVRCQGECVVPLLEGGYFLKVDASKQVIGGRRRFEVSAPSEVAIEPRTHDQRSAGRLMGGLGIGLVLLGAAGMVATGLPVDGEEERDDTQSAVFALSFFGFVGGAVLTPIGWVNAGRSAPALTVTPLAPR